jgi:hypothetical protein
MRQRRVDRLIVRAESALNAGHKDEVAAALDEVRRLAPGIEEIATIERALTSPEKATAPPRSDLAEPDLLIVHDVPTVDGTIEGVTLPAAETSSGYKVAVALGSVLVAAAGLIAWSIYTAPQEQLAALFPAFGEVRVSPPPPPTLSKPRPAATADTQTELPSARVSVETVEAKAYPVNPGTAGPPAAPRSMAPPATSPTGIRAGTGAPAGTSGAPAETTASAANPPPQPMAASVSPAVSERATPPAPPVLDAADTEPLDSRPRAVAALPLTNPPRPERAAASAMAEDYVAVRGVLNKYEAAYSRLDAAAAQEVWPAVNRSALARAFDGLSSQRVSLERCQVSVSGITANANCAGFATWAPKIGNGGPRTEARNWSFQLEKAGADWQIVSARVQNR